MTSMPSKGLCARSLVYSEGLLRNGEILQMWCQVTGKLLWKGLKELLPVSWDLTKVGCHMVTLAIKWLLSSYFMEIASHTCSSPQGPVHSQSAAGPMPLNQQNCKLNEPYFFVELACLSNFIIVTQIQHCNSQSRGWLAILPYQLFISGWASGYFLFLDFRSCNIILFEKKYFSFLFS